MARWVQVSAVSLSLLFLFLQTPSGAQTAPRRDAGSVTIQAGGWGTATRTQSSRDTVFSGGARGAIITVTGLEEALRWGNVTVRSDGDIVVAASLRWTSGNTLTLAAARDIILQEGATIASAGNGSLNLSSAGMLRLNGAIDVSKGAGKIAISSANTPSDLAAYASNIRTSGAVAGQVTVNGRIILASAPGASAALSQKSPDAADIATLADREPFVRIIVEFAAPIPQSEMRPDPAVLAPVRAQIRASQDTLLARHFGSANPQPSVGGFGRSLRRFEVHPVFAINASKAEIEALAADQTVTRIHLDRMGRASLNQSVPLIGMTEPGGPYAVGATGQNKAIAVLDSGVQTNHPFITQAKVIAEACFSTASEARTRTVCPNGLNTQTGTGAGINCPSTLGGCDHGTHVAGIAVGNNTNINAGGPPNGVAKDAKLVAVQVFSQWNFQSDCNTMPAPCARYWQSDSGAALDWVYANMASLPGGVALVSVNMSLVEQLTSSNCDTDFRKPVIDNLRAAGVVTVISAGNDGATSQVTFPSCISTAVSVGATTKDDIIWDYSNMASMVDPLAPGAEIHSSLPTSTYKPMSGTSMAAPHVAGAFTAIRSYCTGKTIDQIETALKSTGMPITDNREGGTETKPRIRVDQALAQLACSGMASIRCTQEAKMCPSGAVVWRTGSACEFAPCPP